MRIASTLIALCLSWASVADPQHAPDDAPKPASTVYLTRDLPIIAQGLEIDDDPALMRILDQMLADYDTAYTRLIETYRQAISKAAETLEGIERSEAFAAASRTCRMAQADLVARFESDVTVLLDDEYDDRWMDVRRHLTRARLLPRGTLRGSRVDLLIVAEDHPDTQKPTARAHLDQWALRIDEALTDRLGWEHLRVDEVLHLVMSDRSSEAADLLEQVYLRGRRVRDLNLESIEAIAESLAQPQADDWRTAAMSAAFPRIFTPDTIDAIVSSVPRVQPPVDREIIEAVDDLYADYRSRRRPIRLARIDVILNREGMDQIRRLRGESVSPDTQTMQLGLQLMTLRQEYLAHLIDLLSRERFEQIRADAQVRHPDVRGLSVHDTRPRPAVASPPTDGPNAGGSTDDAPGPADGLDDADASPGPPTPGGGPPGPGQNMPPPDPDDPTPQDPQPGAPSEPIDPPAGPNIASIRCRPMPPLVALPTPPCSRRTT